MGSLVRIRLRGVNLLLVFKVLSFVGKYLFVSDVNKCGISI